LADSGFFQAPVMPASIEAQTSASFSLNTLLSLALSSKGAAHSRHTML